MDRIDELIADVKNNVDDYIVELKETYKKELKGYEYIPTDRIERMKLGGYVRYVDKEGVLKYGGILISYEGTDIHVKYNKFIYPERKPEPIKYSKVKLVLKNSEKKVWKVGIGNKYIFYKGHVTMDDKNREIFVTLAEMEEMEKEKAKNN